jgi:puromycin-sensitive aminopeptidase
MIDIKSYRLPDWVNPTHYKIFLEPNLTSSTFEGTVEIDITILKETNEIVLNVCELDIKNCSIIKNPNLTEVPLDIILDDKTERIKFKFKSDLSPGRYTLKINFSGKLNDQLRGFYRSNFIDAQGVSHTIATTQFESTDARRAFPCWDEPSFKATFNISLVVPRDQFVVSNAPIKKETNIGTDRRHVQFEDTMKMSTYLVAFIIGPFEATEPIDVSGTPLRIIHPRGKGNLTEYALEAGSFALNFFSEYYGIKYPGQKLDMVAIPDFAFGAMENLGCITYREVLLLVDKHQSTESELLRIADVIAHEIAHMWFGDLVTMEWWNGIWLNEAFATFMATLCSDSFNPDWHRWDQFSLERSMAFDVDSLDNSRPIEYPVISPSDADGMFDLLTYEKGGSVLRMLEQFLGPNNFRDGIRHYLKKHSYGNTETKDLWDSIEEVTGEPVRKIMDSWIFQKGYPIVSPDDVEDNEVLYLTQEKFTFDQSKDETTWIVPVVIRTQTGTEHKFLLDSQKAGFNTGEKNARAVINAGGHGFYRVRYPQQSLLGITDSMFNNLSSIERYGLIDDSWASVMSGRMSAADFFSFISEFGIETDMDVWTLVGGCLARLDRLIDGDPSEIFREKIGKLVHKCFTQIGWIPSDGESSREKELRGILIRILGNTAKDHGTIMRSKKIHKILLDDPSVVEPNIAAATTSIVASVGNELDYETFYSCYKKAKTPQEERRYLGALTLFPGASEMAKTLNKTVNGEIRTQDSPYIVASCLANKKNGWMAWEHISSNWERLIEMYPANSIVRMVGPVTYLDTKEKCEEVEQFFKEHTVPQGELTLKQTLEKLKINVAFRKRESKKFRSALLNNL